MNYLDRKIISECFTQSDADNTDYFDNHRMKDNIVQISNLIIQNILRNPSGSYTVMERSTLEAQFPDETKWNTLVKYIYLLTVSALEANFKGKIKGSLGVSHNGMDSDMFSFIHTIEDDDEQKEN